MFAFVVLLVLLSHGQLKLLNTGILLLRGKPDRAAYIPYTGTDRVIYPVIGIKKQHAVTSMDKLTKCAIASLHRMEASPTFLSPTFLAV